MKKLRLVLLMATTTLGLSACSFDEAWNKVKDTSTSAVDSIKDLFNKDNDDDLSPNENIDFTHEHTFASEWSINETSHYHSATCEHNDEKADVGLHEFDINGHCTVCDYYNSSKDEGLVFNEEKLGYLCGRFYADNYVLDISKYGALISGESTKILSNSRIEGNKYSTVVTYKDSDGEEYILSWKQAEYDKHGYGFMLPTLTKKDREIQFQPDISEYQGWYDEWKMLDNHFSYYIVTNEFNPTVNMFNIYTVNWDSETFLKDIYYAAVSFKDINGETKLCFSRFGTTDLDLGFNPTGWNSYLYKDSETGKIKMMTMDSKNAKWETNLAFLLGVYWDDDFELDGLNGIYDGLYFEINDTEKTLRIYKNYVLIGEGPYFESFDENGQFLVFGGTKIRGTTGGISIETNNEVKNYIPFFKTNLMEIKNKTFLSNGESVFYGVDWNTGVEDFFINGEQVDNAILTKNNGEIAYKLKKGNDIYYVCPGITEDFIEVTKNNETNRYFSQDVMMKFVQTFIDFDENVLQIDASFSATLNGHEFGYGEFVYDDYFNDVALHLTSGIAIAEADANNGVYKFVSDDFLTAGYFLVESIGHSYYGIWSDGEKTLEAYKIEENKVISYDGVSLIFGGYGLLRGSDGSFICGVFLLDPSTQTEYILLLFSDSLQLFYYINGQLTFITGFYKV